MVMTTSSHRAQKYRNAEAPTYHLPSSQFSVQQDIEKNENALKLKRSQSRVKQVEFELAVMKEVAEVRTQQLRDSEAMVEKLQKDLSEAKQKYGSEPQPLQKEIKVKKTSEPLNEIDRAEVVELRSELQNSQNRLDNLEKERHIHLAKVAELLKILSLGNASDTETELYSKALQVAELEGNLDAVRKQLGKAQDRVEQLSQERQANMNMVAELTQAIRGSGVDNHEVEQVLCYLKAGRKLSPKDAQLLTIQHLKTRVETLEEEKTRFVSQIAALTDEVISANMNTKQTSRPSLKNLLG